LDHELECSSSFVMQHIPLLFGEHCVMLQPFGTGLFGSSHG